MNTRSAQQAAGTGLFAGTGKKHPPACGTRIPEQGAATFISSDSFISFISFIGQGPALSTAC
jgi:hypothetical protein